MTSGFQSFDVNGNLQFTTEAQAYCVVTSSSAAVTNVSNSYGSVTISMSNTSDLVAFRSPTCGSMTGYRRATSYNIITQDLSGTIYYKILRPFSAIASSVDTFGLQLFTSDGSLAWSALQNTAYIYNVVSVYGDAGLGDVGDGITCPTNSNPYALILGSEVVTYIGSQEVDNYDRGIGIQQTTSNTITVGSYDGNSWPGMPNKPSTFGRSYPGTYTVGAIY